MHKPRTSRQPSFRLSDALKTLQYSSLPSLLSHRDSPQNCVALNNLGVALLALGQQDEGLSMLEKSFELDPFEPDVLVNLGIHWQEDGDLDRAQSFYTRQGKRRPQPIASPNPAPILPPTQEEGGFCYIRLYTLCEASFTTAAN